MTDIPYRVPLKGACDNSRQFQWQFAPTLKALRRPQPPAHLNNTPQVSTSYARTHLQVDKAHRAKNTGVQPHPLGTAFYKRVLCDRLSALTQCPKPRCIPRRNISTPRTSVGPLRGYSDPTIAAGRRDCAMKNWLHRGSPKRGMQVQHSKWAGYARRFV